MPILGKCGVCGTEFKYSPSQKKQYCSLECAYKSPKRKETLRKAASGKNNPWYGKKRPEHSKKMSGSNNANWKGGRSKTESGYILVKAPEGHPYPKAHGYILEHRLIMEKKLGRYLKPNECVHHINGNKTDNRLDNLELCSPSDHRRKHPSPMLGKKHTEETKNKLRKAHTGKKLTKEHKEKISLSGRIYQQRVREALKKEK